MVNKENHIKKRGSFLKKKKHDSEQKGCVGCRRGRSPPTGSNKRSRSIWALVITVAPEKQPTHLKKKN